MNFAKSKVTLEFAFTINQVGQIHSGSVTIEVGGVKFSDVIIDSGATCNIISESTWQIAKKQKIVCSSSAGSEKKLFAYGSDTPLPIVGEFSALVKSGNEQVTATFIVIKGNGRSLLGKETAEVLKILKVGPDSYSNIHHITLDDIKHEFKECFEGFGKLKDFAVKLHIDKSVVPVAQKVRRIPFSIRKQVENKIHELLEKDIIEKVEGPTPWVSPIVVIPTSSGDVRICVDMREANQAVIRERHPIPTLDEVIQNMNQSKIFSKLDLRYGYHQLELEVSSRYVTTFATHIGLFRYKRLMFGISSASEVYQRVIQQTLAGCDGVENISDDIIVHGRTLEEHDKRLVQVLSVIKERGLTLNKDKCILRMRQLTFLGMVLSENGIGLTESKVKAISEAREPQNKSEVRSFLGLVQYCGQFIPNLATKTEPLRQILKKNTEFVWNESQQKAFLELKEELKHPRTLAYFDQNAAKTQIIADASPVGLGSVLVQEQNGQMRIIAYASKSLTDVERRYSQTEREALSLVWACEHFHTYLYGLDFELVTDHKPLEYIYSTKSKPSARIERWVLRLQSYRFKVKYISGPNNIADSLSRLMKSENEDNSNSKTEEYVQFVARNAVPRAISKQDVERHATSDPEIVVLRRCIQSGQWNDCPEGYKQVRYELSNVGSIVLRGHRIIVPSALREQVIHLAHEGHQGIVKTKQQLRSKV